MERIPVESLEFIEIPYRLDDSIALVTKVEWAALDNDVDHPVELDWTIGADVAVPIAGMHKLRCMILAADLGVGVWHFWARITQGAGGDPDQQLIVVRSGPLEIF